MKIGYMKEYIALAEKLNFTEAANELYITQPALSKHLTFIEQTLGVPLLIRTTHAVELTSEGKIVYEEFKKIVFNYNYLVSKIQATSKGIVGNLNIGILYYAISEYIEPLVKNVSEVYPNIGISLKSCQPYQIFKYLSDDVIDIGMAMYFESMDFPKYMFYPVRKEKLKLIVLPNHPFAAKKSVSLTEISREKLVVLTMDKEYSESLIRLLRKYKALPDNLVNAEQVDILPLVLQKSDGVFIGPELLKNMPRKDLVFIDIESDDFNFEMCFVYRKSNSNPSIPLFLKVLEDTT